MRNAYTITFLLLYRMRNIVVVQDVPGANISLTAAVKKSKLFLQVSYLLQLNSIIHINFGVFALSWRLLFL